MSNNQKSFNDRVLNENIRMTHVDAKSQLKARNEIERERMWFSKVLEKKPYERMNL